MFIDNCLVSNIGQPEGGLIGNLSLDWAQEFTTGSHIKGYTVNSVDVRFRNNELKDLFRTNNPRLTVTIRNKSNGDPGTIVGTLKLPASSPTFTSSRIINFPAPGKGIKLSPSTTYFLVIGTDDQRSTGGKARLRTLDSDDEDAGGAAGFSIRNVGSNLQWWVNPPSWIHSGPSLNIGINGEPIPITDFILTKNATRSIAEFGAPSDPGSEDSLRVIVTIGDGLSPQPRRSVNYTVGGTATLGTDYKIEGCTSSPCTSVFPDGRHSLVIPIDVINDDLDEPDETIIITLTGGEGYTLPAEDKRTTTVTILDDDTRGLTFHRRWPDVPEGGSQTYTVRLKSQPTAAVTVNIASNNQDVTVSPTSLTFQPSGSTNLWNWTRTVSVSAAQDIDAVDDQATLTHTTSGGDYGGANALSIDRLISVDDDDTGTTTGPRLPRVSLTGGADVTEGGTASFTVSADPAPTARITVNVEVFERQGQAFVAASHEGVRTVTLNAGATSATFTVPTVDDNADEDDGYVQAFVNDGTGYLAGQGAAVTVLDNDDPIPGAFFRSASSDAVEHGGTQSVQLELNYPAPAGGLTLRYSVSGTATAGSGNDFTIQNSGTVSIAARGASATIPVAINDDSSKENAETVVLTLIGGTGYTLDSPSVHTLTIEDNDSTSASFATASAIVAESAGTHAVTVNLNQAASTGGLTIGYTIAGTATAGSGNDFTIASSGSLSIAQGSTSAEIAVAINDDSAEESAETVILTLTSGTGYTLGSPTTHTLTIAENDRPAISARVFLFESSSPMPEGARGKTNLLLNRPLRNDETATLPLTIGGTATLGTDYRLTCVSQEPVVFWTCSDLTGNNPSITLDGALLQGRRRFGGPLYIEALEDNTAESDETVILSLGGNAFTLTIKDSPSSAALTFTKNAFLGSEQYNVVEPILRISPALGQDLTIPLIITDISATGGVDYTPLTQVVLKATGDDTYAVSIPILPDTVYEGDETFTVAIDTANLPTGVTAGATTAATVTIVDDDPAPNSQLVLSRSSLTVAEGSTGSYTLKLATQPTGTVTVNIASSNNDVTVSPNPVTFQSSGSSKLWSVAQTITVTAGQDVDANEDSGTLTHSASGGGYDSLSGSVSVTVNDDDTAQPSASFASATSAAAESAGTRNVRVNLSSAAPAGGLTLNYSVGGTATAGSGNDFTIQNSGTLTIAAGASTANIPVAINDDSATEGDETVILTLASGTGYSPGSPGVHTLTITDNDATGQATLSLSGPAGADEGNSGTSDKRFTVSLSKAPSRFVSWQLCFSGSATIDAAGAGTIPAGADYQAISGQTPIDLRGRSPVCTSRTFKTTDSSFTNTDLGIRIKGDTESESDETVIVTLSIDDGPADVVLGTSAVTYTIRDDDASQPTASFASRSSSAAENAGTRNVRVNLSPAAPAGGLTLSYSVTGSATAGSDFTIRNSGTLSVAAEATSAVIPVAIEDDGTEESDETVILTLSAATGYTLGSTRAHTLTITDNDGDDHQAGMATVSVSDAKGYKACGSITFKVSVNRAIDAVTDPNGIGISVRTRESTPVAAVEGTDFHANAETFRFNPGDNLHKQFQVRLVDAPNESGQRKTFEVVLHDVSGAQIGDGVAVGTILDDFPLAGCGRSQAHAPLLPSSSNPLREGLVRIINPSAQAAQVRIVAIDDAGWPSAPVTLGIGAGGSAQFTSRDLESGNAARGLFGSAGPGTGDWRLEIASDLDVEVLPYVLPHVRTADGTLSAMREVVAAEGNLHRVALFNPADSPHAASRLRLTNRGAQALRADITGVDDAGSSPGGSVSVEIAAHASLLLTAAELETGGSNLLGALGDGEGQWRLDIASDGDLAVMNLVETSDGKLTNLSNASATTVPAREAHVVDRFPSSADTSNEQGVVRIVNSSESPAAVRIEPNDSTGWRYPPLTLTLGAGQAANLGTRDLELGNAAKGLSGSAGPGVGGAWRLAISSDDDIEVLTYTRAPNGLLKLPPGDAETKHKAR